MAGPIHFFFDFSSPYAWFALKGIEELARKHRRDIAWRPVLLWAVLKAQGLPAPLAVPARRDYLVADMVRSAAFHDIPFSLPEPLGVSTHLAARLFYALTEARPEIAPQVAHALLRAHLADGRSLTEEAVVLEIAAAFGMAEAAARAALADPGAKQHLAAAVGEAVAAGVCGSPYFVLDGEGFFGADRLPQIAWRLAGGDRREPA